MGGQVRHQAIGPMLTGAAGTSAVALLMVRDPHVVGSYGTCPFLAVTGMPCPGCGGLRAVDDLARGDLAGAVGSNALVVLMVLVAVGVWASWTARTVGRGSWVAPRPTVAWGYVAVALVVAFGVVRNLPFGAALAP